MNQDEIIHEMKMKIILREWKLQKGVKTKREEAVLRGQIDELNSMIELIEYRSKQKTMDY